MTPVDELESAAMALPRAERARLPGQYHVVQGRNASTQGRPFCHGHAPLLGEHWRPWQRHSNGMRQRRRRTVESTA